MSDNIGDKIGGIINDVLNGENLDSLNRRITETVDAAMNEAKTGAEQSIKSAKKSVKEVMGAVSGKQGGLMPVNKSRISRFAGGAKFGIGIFGAVILSFITLILFGAAGISGDAKAVMITLLIMGIITLAGDVLCAALAVSGKKQWNLCGRLGMYMEYLQKEPHGEIKKLAASAGNSEERTAKDMARLIEKGVFPEGHLDEERGYFCGTDELYGLYTQALEAESQRRAARENETDDQRAVREALDTGREFIRDIRVSNNLIPDEVMSKKLDTTEAIVGKIFARIEEKPELLPEIRKFIQYYLPLTKNLVSAYERFERQGAASESVKKSKAEIESTMDTINKAYYNLYAGLFDDEVIDINSDISVLNAMLAQEGLIRDDINKR